MAEQDPLSPPRVSSQGHVDKATQTILNMRNLLSFLVPEMLQESLQTGTLQEASPSLRNLQEASPSLRNLQEASPSLRNLQEASPSLRNLQEASPSLRNLQEASPSLRNLQEASPSLRNLQEASPSLRNLQEASPSLRNLQEASPSLRNLQEASPSLRNLQEASPSPRNLQEASPSPRNLQEASPSPRNLQEASPSPRNQQAASPSPRNLQEASPSLRNLQEASPSPRNLQEASPSLRNLQEASPSPRNLQEASPSPRNLQAASSSLGTIQRAQDNLWDPTSSASLDSAAVRETSGTCDVQGSGDVMPGGQVTRNESGVQERIGASGVQLSRSALYVRRTSRESHVQRSSCELDELRLGDLSGIPGAENRSGFQRCCNESDALERSWIEPSVFGERSDCVQGRSMHGTNNSVHYHEDILERLRSEASAWGRSETVQGRSMPGILNNEHDHDNTHNTLKSSHGDERCTEKCSHELVEVESETNVNSGCSTALEPEVKTEVKSYDEGSQEQSLQPLTQQLDNSNVSQPEPPLTDIDNTSPQQCIPHVVSQTNIPSSTVFTHPYLQEYIPLTNIDETISVPDISYGYPPVNPYFQRTASSWEEYCSPRTHHNTASRMQGSCEEPDPASELDKNGSLGSNLRPIPTTNETSLFPPPSPPSLEIIGEHILRLEESLANAQEQRIGPSYQPQTSIVLTSGDITNGFSVIQCFAPNTTNVSNGVPAIPSPITTTNEEDPGCFPFIPSCSKGFPFISQSAST
ncbi:hypothetical protein Pcinc_026474 [Petrolisthes cinctipes]|uniref:Uncharacterized protein n=1 Tax=Petrolisthes cinctipes TaxID=88211 RepID=A0AAE1F6K5_PETCI|nr:hypothetical protein Pcinc_026474 [Petrolisthes cinctipes]